jgi:hypothetical protein
MSFIFLKEFLFLGYYRLLREGRAPMASPEPLSMTSEEDSISLM